MPNGTGYLNANRHLSIKTEQLFTDYKMLLFKVIQLCHWSWNFSHLSGLKRRSYCTHIQNTYKHRGQLQLGHYLCHKKIKWRLHGCHFTFITGHRPLVSIICSKKGILVYTSNRLQRINSYRNPRTFTQLTGQYVLIESSNNSSKLVLPFLTLVEQFCLANSSP